MSGLGNTIREAVKKLAYGASLEQLKKRGVKQVNVIGVDRIVSLVEEAVNRTLRSRLMGLERAEVADAAKQEFLRMLHRPEEDRHRDELAEMQQRAQEEVQDLRRQLEQQNRALEERLGLAARDELARHEGEDAELAELLDQEMRAFARRGDTDLGSLRDRVFALFTERIQKARAEALEAKEAARDREVDLLQRRVAKMTEALAENERRLAEAESLGSVDPGIPSIYRGVQGLQPETADFRRKKALMSEIFKANLALQKGMQ